MEKKITLNFFGLHPSFRTINSVFPLNTLDVLFTAATAEDKSHDLAPALGAEEFQSSFSDKTLPRVAGNSLFSWVLCKVKLFGKGHPPIMLNRLKLGGKQGCGTADPAAHGSLGPRQVLLTQEKQREGREFKL